MAAMPFHCKPCPLLSRPVGIVGVTCCTTTALQGGGRPARAGRLQRRLRAAAPLHPAAHRRQRGPQGPRAGKACQRWQGCVRASWVGRQGRRRCVARMRRLLLQVPCCFDFDCRGKDARPSLLTSGKPSGGSVQVCAPSNSALDEIVLRLITVGLTDQDGRVFTPNVVRAALRCATLCHAVLPCISGLQVCIGHAETTAETTALCCPPAHTCAHPVPSRPTPPRPPCQVRVGVSIHHSVQSVALDTLVEHRLGGDAAKNVQRWERDRLRMQILEEANIGGWGWGGWGVRGGAAWVRWVACSVPRASVLLCMGLSCRLRPVITTGPAAPLPGPQSAPPSASAAAAPSRG